MRKLLNLFDDISGKITMYKSIAWSLSALILIALVMALLGVIDISASGLAAVTAVLTLSCYASNKLFGRLFKAPTNSESALITALILACIVAPELSLERLGFAALAGVIAMASKYIITWRGSHFLNPAAFGAFVLSATDLLPAIWWVASPELLPVTVAIALIQLRRHRKFAMFFVFAGTALAVMMLVQDGPASQLLKDGLLSYPIIFLGAVMLTEPITMPTGKQNQLLFGLIVGALFSSQLELGPVFMSPMLALLAGNLFGVLISPPFGASLKLRESKRLAPDILELTFDKPAKLSFSAGQYMQFTLPHARADVRGNRRSFSLASAPNESVLKITTRLPSKRISSFKTALIKLQPGDRLRASDVSGSFVVPPGRDKLLFIAGGIGITPFRSMIGQLMARKLRRDIVLIYAASSSEQFIYKDVFKAAIQSGVRTEYAVGRLDKGSIKNLVPDFVDRQVYVSGSTGMVNATSDQLRGLGVGSRRIHTDHFTGY